MGTTLGGDGLIDGAVLRMVKTQDATLPAFSQLAQTVQPTVRFGPRSPADHDGRSEGPHTPCRAAWLRSDGSFALKPLAIEVWVTGSDTNLNKPAKYRHPLTGCK